MSSIGTPIAYLDGQRMMRALRSGIHHVFESREHLNRINVFPVPDGDTGTNMVFTLKAIRDRISRNPVQRIDEFMQTVSDAALDGARGNSGAILAQFLCGFGEAVHGKSSINAAQLATASMNGASSAWKALSNPVPGTLPTVLEDFAGELKRCVDDGVEDIRSLAQQGLSRAQASLANTPELLPALKQAGVVDAAGQGFVDLLEGIWHYLEHGQARSEKIDAPPEDISAVSGAHHVENPEHRYCTECVVEGNGMDRDKLMQKLTALDASSAVVAGSSSHIKVHIHVDDPASVFDICETMGQVSQQKADDMEQQVAMQSHPGPVAVVTDSGADMPENERERSCINVVPVRLSFGDREYLDRVSMTAPAFYRRLRSCEEYPLTSQPPPSAFARQYGLLCSQGFDVISVGLSENISGTTSAARAAVNRLNNGTVRVFDTRNASCGQGLLALAAGEAAAAGKTLDEIEDLLSRLAPHTLTVAAVDDLSYVVRGGRVPAWIKKLADLLHINPILCSSKTGTLRLMSVQAGRGVNPKTLARKVLGKLKSGTQYRLMISHADNPDDAEALKEILAQSDANISQCLIAEAGAALGVHAGPGGLLVGLMPEPSELI